MRAATATSALGLSVLVLSCGRSGDAPVSSPVTWTFQLNDSTEVQMPGRITGDTLVWHNGKEDVLARQIDDTTWALHPFDGRITGHWKDQQFAGNWNDRQRGEYRIPLTGKLEEERWPHVWPEQPPQFAWDFYLPADDSVPMGTLLLHEAGDWLTGTIATPTGDFRFLTGSKNRLQTFDGAHLYQITGNFPEANLQGMFYSGTHYAAPFRAEQLTAIPQLTAQEAQIKPNAEFSLAFYDSAMNQQVWGLEDLPKDVTVIDIMGTWCPNCLDEMHTLLQLHREYPDVGFMTIAFERNALGNPQQARERLLQYVKTLDIPWAVEIGGNSDKTVAQEAFPFLERVASFPTTLFVHKDGRIRTHSGFNGPATGAAYEAEQATFRRYLDELLDQP